MLLEIMAYSFLLIKSTITNYCCWYHGPRVWGWFVRLAGDAVTKNQDECIGNILNSGPALVGLYFLDRFLLGFVL
ncbi:hypothetical protein [uncultured Nitrosomonas sp.]|uniref:hypothetical protein n=1 Tax=uncultured Nitrosomonas sp. TaxID=156424 RepID=UPI0025F6D4E2|nr:hypothetical protein [uncultured Nitrosomonas sp.]